MPSPNQGAGIRGTRPGTSDSNRLARPGRVRVEEIQRARLIAAMVEVSSKYGLVDATVARVVARAGVSRRTFYELFEDREECFLAALDGAIARASRCVLDAYDPDAKWAERIRVALTSLLSFLDVEHGMGKLLIVESLGATPKALERRQRVLTQIVTAIDEGRGEAKDGLELPPLTAEGVVGGAFSVIHTRLIMHLPPAVALRQREPRPRLVELVGPLMSMIVLPYLGSAAARRELKQPVPEPSSRVELTGEDPLRDLGMRLTYRTVRVLMAIAATPGSSNREIGEAAGMVDQGQISKLLGRLERLGLLHNKGLEPGKGAPNAWALTERGVQVERVMSADNGPRVALSARSCR